MENIERRRDSKSVGLRGVGMWAVGIGAVAVGAFAIGALVIQRLTIRHIVIDRADIKCLSIGELAVDRIGEAVSPAVKS